VPTQTSALSADRLERARRPRGRVARAEHAVPSGLLAHRGAAAVDRDALWEGVPRLDLSVALPSRRCAGRRSPVDDDVRAGSYLGC